MNIYFINPKDFNPSSFHHLIDMLKVTTIYSLIRTGGLKPFSGSARILGTLIGDDMR